MKLFGYTRPYFRYEAPGEGGTGNSPAPAPQDVSDLQAFRELGLTPAQLDNILEDYVRLAKGGKPKESSPDVPPKKTTNSKPVFADEEAAKEAFLKMFPHLAKGDEFEKRLQSAEERTNKLHRSDVDSTKEQSQREVLRYVVNTLGADVESAQGQKFLNTVLRIANDRLTGNVDAMQAFIDGDKKVVQRILNDMKNDGVFESMNIPKARRDPRFPYLSGTEGQSNAIKDKYEANAEKYKGMPPAKRFLEMSKDIYADVFPEA